MSSALPERCRVVVTRLLPPPLMQRLQSSFHGWTNPADHTLASDSITREATAICADLLLVMAMDSIDAGLIRSCRSACA